MESKKTMVQTPGMNQPWGFQSVVDTQEPVLQAGQEQGSQTILESSQNDGRLLVVVVLVIDLTGSMAGSGHRIPVMAAAERTIEALQALALDVLIGLVLFGDERYNEQPVCLPVGTQPDKLKEAILNAPGYDGGDLEESSLLALHRALALPGHQHGAQTVVILATDGPPRSEEQGVTADSVLGELKKEGATLIACAPKHPDFVRLANGTGGLLIEISPGLPPQAFHDALMAAVKATVTTITTETAKHDEALQRQIAEASQEFHG